MVRKPKSFHNHKHKHKSTQESPVPLRPLPSLYPSKDSFSQNVRHTLSQLLSLPFGILKYYIICHIMLFYMLLVYMWICPVVLPIWLKHIISTLFVTMYDFQAILFQMLSSFIHNNRWHILLYIYCTLKHLWIEGHFIIAYNYFL